jgi:hypothetical protein
MHLHPLSRPGSPRCSTQRALKSPQRVLKSPQRALKSPQRALNSLQSALKKSPQRSKRFQLVGGEHSMSKTLKSLQEYLQTGEGSTDELKKQHKNVKIRMKAVFTYINGVIHPGDYVKRVNKLDKRTIHAIQTRISSLRLSIRGVMVSYGLLLDENDDPFDYLCQTALEQMFSYIILRDFATVSEIQDRQIKSTMSSFIERLTPMISQFFNTSATITIEKVEFTVEDLCHSLRYTSLFADGEPIYRKSSTQNGGGGAPDGSYFVLGLTAFAAGISNSAPFMGFVVFVIMYLVETRYGWGETYRNDDGDGEDVDNVERGHDIQDGRNSEPSSRRGSINPPPDRFNYGSNYD